MEPPARRSTSTPTMKVAKTDILETIEGTLKTSVISVEAAGQDHPVFLWLASLGPTSRRSMLSALARGTRLLREAAADPLRVDWRAFGHQHMLQVRVGLESVGSVCSRNLTLAALRGVMRTAWQAGLVPLDQYERVRSIKNFRQIGDAGTGRAVTRAERTRLLRLAGVHPRVVCRDRALIALMLVLGLRRSEAASLTHKALHLAEQHLVIVGKGGRVRRLPIPTTVMPMLRAWLQELPEGGKFVFPRISRTGRVLIDLPITGTAVALLLRRRCALSGLERIRPHDLRRTTATDALEAGCDLLAVQAILGHSTPAVTVRYDRRGDASRRAVTEAVFVPLSIVDPG